MTRRYRAKTGILALSLASPFGCASVVTETPDAGRTSGTSTTTGSGGASTTSTSSTGGTGGSACTTPADCPGTDTPCQSRTCTDGACGFFHPPAGAPTLEQTTGDCQLVVCDGNGGITTQPDDTDLPDSANPCTADTCADGVPAHADELSGTLCGDALICDGAGQCVGCVSPDDCPGQDAACQQRACTAGVCGVTNAPANMPLPGADQTSGDCQSKVCDGTGGVTSIADDTDLPNPVNACAAGACTNGAVSSTPLPAGTPCNQSGGAMCDGNAACVQCLQPSDCPGQDTACQQRACTAGVCGFANTPANTPLPAAQQAAADCQSKVCDGSGGMTSIADDTDLPISTNDCAAGTCTSGAVSSTPLPAGTACNQNGGAVCDGNAACVQCNQGSDCTSGVCQAHVCQAPTCSDGVRNQGELGTDCGGPCAAVCPTVVLIATGPSGTLGATYHPGGVWTTTSLGGMSTEPPSAAFMSTGEAVGGIRLTESGNPSDNNVQYVTWAAEMWTSFTDVGPGIATTHGPSVSADGASVSAAYRGIDGKYYLLARSGGVWSGAQPVTNGGVQSAGLLAPAFTQAAGVLAFIGGDLGLYTQVLDGGAWGAPTWISSADMVAPVAFSYFTSLPHPIGTVNFVRAQAATWEFWNGSTLDGPYPISGFGPTVDPVASATLPPSVGFFIAAFRRQDGYIYYRLHDGIHFATLALWTPNVFAASPPALATGVAGASAEVAFIQPDGVAYHARLIGNAWTPPVAIGGSNLTQVAIASWTP